VLVLKYVLFHFSKEGSLSTLQIESNCVYEKFLLYTNYYSTCLILPKVFAPEHPNARTILIIINNFFIIYMLLTKHYKDLYNTYIY
jgi:hypothetical protein